MFQFNEFLEKNNLDSHLTYPVFKPYISKVQNSVYKFIDTILCKNKRVMLYGDYDLDGASCCLQWKYFFDSVGFSNYTIFPYNNRMHTLDPLLVKTVIEKKYDCCIINDTATNEFSKIRELLCFKKEILIIDHHEPKQGYADYPNNCTIVNSCLEDDLVVSAGALVTHLLTAYTIEKFPEVNRVPFFVYGLISLYADCIDMSHVKNVSLYHMAVNQNRVSLPALVKLLLPKYQILCRRAIEFNISPVINCGFRQEFFTALNNILYAQNKLGDVNLNDYIEQLQNLHLQSAKRTATVADIIPVEQWDNFVIANLDNVQQVYDIESTHLYNYTGLVANKLSEKYVKPAIVLCSRGEVYKGSFRDIQSRDYLSLLQQLCYAEGHKPAFGIEIPKLNINRFLRQLKKLDSKQMNTSIPNKPIIVSLTEFDLTEKLVHDIALYNEFTGSRPVALIKLNALTTLKTKGYRNSRYHFTINDIPVSSAKSLFTTSSVLVKPTIGKQDKLYVI